MKNTILLFISLIMLASSCVLAQQSDSTIIFTSPNPEIFAPKQSNLLDAWGVDILLSGNGFGLGGFYRREFTKELYGTVTFAISDSKDDNEVEYVDWYGQTFSPGKIKRFLLMPLLFGVQYRIFSEDIIDNFRPYINAGFGPTMVFASPYNKEFFNSLSYGQPHYTAGGYIGLGAFFGNDKGSLSGVNIRYYFVPFASGIESIQNANGSISKKKDFGGFFITLNLGSAF